MTIQMDIRKAYDSFDWTVLENMLKEIGFPRRFTNWVMLAVTIISYIFRAMENTQRF